MSHTIEIEAGGRYILRNGLKAIVQTIGTSMSHGKTLHPRGWVFSTWLSSGKIHPDEMEDEYDIVERDEEV